ncbi:MAG: CHAT domain-containing protein [Jaaginema sp. PMC 1079.18]|nr:CHAT domain-containing protein [Jaaginema sp. PMC 1080.18]MEC4853427.1 CHAT domain-containing protein [Jaaginema sp. PMC 1079.18]MEC4866922.1 CHAT domain-containing protein [Jaaginema sp. PMC 1078.18]
MLLTIYVHSQPVIAQSTSYQELLDDAENAYNSGEIEDAIALLQQIAQQGTISQKITAQINLSLAYQSLGEWTLAQNSLTVSFELIPQIAESRDRTLSLAQASETQGKLHFTLGNFLEALESYQTATQHFQELLNSNDSNTFFVTSVFRNNLHQVTVLKEMGRYRRALKQLVPLVEFLSKNDESIIQANALHLLANLIQIMGNDPLLDNEIEALWQSRSEEVSDYLEKARRLLQLSDRIARKKGDILLQSNILLSLGNLEQAAYIRAHDEYERSPSSDLNLAIQKQYAENALNYYQQVVATFQPSTVTLLAQLNQLSLIVNLQQSYPQHQETIETLLQTYPSVSELEQTILQQLNSLPPSQKTVDARINLANTLLQLKNSANFPEIETQLQQSLNQAEQIHNKRSQSYAVGKLGTLYEQKQQWEQALTSTTTAISLTQDESLTYQWEWQLGRILAKQGKIKDAIAAYEQSIQSLDKVRKDLVSLQNPETRFLFRDNVEPVYRELVDLLLPKDNTNADENNLEKSIYYIDALQLAELEDYLRCDLSEALGEGDRADKLARHLAKITQDDPTLAFLYTIILPQKFVAILKLPNQSRLLYHVTNVTDTEVLSTIKQASKNLTDEKLFSLQHHSEPLFQLYQWLLADFEDELKNNNIQTLSFVLDRTLQSIPPSTLYDGEKFLIQKGYNVTVTPTIQLFQTQPWSFSNQNTLVIGAVKDRLPNFASLTPKVPEQIEQISQILPNYELLTQGNFTKQTLRDRLNNGNYNILHFATHGKFSSRFEDTYIITDDEGEDYRININQFSQLIQQTTSQNNLDLLVFSACETASGDRRAILGMSGIAIRSGAIGTIGTAWTSEQGATNTFVTHFYKYLVEQKVSKAEALRLAQLDMIQTSKPKQWAPFILIGY